MTSIRHSGHQYSLAMSHQTAEETKAAKNVDPSQAEAELADRRCAALKLQLQWAADEMWRLLCKTPQTMTPRDAENAMMLSRYRVFLQDRIRENTVLHPQDLIMH